VSDAGTPGISDPGYLLVRALREAGLKICSVPGASAFTAALAVAGQPPLPAVLVGFLPPRPGARRRRVGEFARWPNTLVVFLSPHRLAAEIADLATGLGRDREATLLAELSKLHERAWMGTLGDFVDGPEAEAPRGEYVLVIGPGQPESQDKLEPSPEMVAAAYREATQRGLDRSSALHEVAAELGLRRRQVYAMLLDAKKGPTEDA
jgi:16S rRNA (cytidine1402-2'-O)-methyltransferase